MCRLFRKHKIEILTALLVLVIVGPLVHDYAAQQASRYAFTAAVVDGHTVQLDHYSDVLGIDKSVYRGHIYSDKAPGQPLLAVPFYALYRWVGGRPGDVLQVERNIGLWWLTLWFAAIPGAVLAAVMYRQAARLVPDMALNVALGMSLGTILLPFSALLFGHVLAALLGFVAWSVLLPTPSKRRLLLAGAAVGLAVTIEYTMAIVVVVLGVYVAAIARKKVGWYVIGGTPFALALCLYNWLVFGSPLVSSYQLSAFGGAPAAARPLLDLFGRFHPERLLQLFLAPRGFLVATPLVVIGLAGIGMMIRRRDHRAEALVAGAIFLGFLLIPVMWGNPWGGDSPGPRYMLPAIPFLASPVALAWLRWPMLSRVAAEVGALTMGLATLTDPLLPREVGYGVVAWFSSAIHGGWVPSIFTINFGSWGWLLHGALLISAALVLVSEERKVHRVPAAPLTSDQSL